MAGEAWADSNAASAAAVSEAALPEGASASIILISNARASSGLRALLAELLERQGVSCDLSEASRFDPQTLFAAPTAEPRVLVLIVLEPNRARLYFRGPTGQRFLLRQLPLPNGLDEVGQELVGQVVESSTLTLFYSTDGLSRAQASDELTREATVATSPSSPAPLAPPASPPIEQAPRRKPSEPSPVEWTLGVRYAAAWTGTDLGFLHGPGLELAVGYRARTLVRFRLSVDRWLERALSDSEVSANLDGLGVRAGVELGLPLTKRQTLLVGLAAGVDVLRLDSVSSSNPQISLAGASTDVAPVARFELRYELLFSRFLLAAGPFLDASLVDTHYDLLDGSERRRVASPWLTRPGFSLVCGLRF